MAYAKKDLERWLAKYIKAHPHERVTVLALVAFSGISKATWYRNEDIIEKIRVVNETPIIIEMEDDGVLPTAKQIVRSCKNDDELIKTVQSLLDEIASLRAACGKDNINKLKATVATQKGQIKERDERIRVLEAQVHGQVVDALPDLSPQAIIDSTNTSRFIDRFDDLFGGADDE